MTFVTYVTIFENMLKILRVFMVIFTVNVYVFCISPVCIINSQLMYTVIKLRKEEAKRKETLIKFILVNVFSQEICTRPGTQCWQKSDSDPN